MKFSGNAPLITGVDIGSTAVRIAVGHMVEQAGKELLQIEIYMVAICADCGFSLIKRKLYGEIHYYVNIILTDCGFNYRVVQLLYFKALRLERG